MTLCRLRLIAALAAFALLGAAAPAIAAIVPFKSIAGIEVGTSEAELREQLGDPTRVEQGPDVGARVFVYKRRKLEIAVADGRAVEIVSRSRAQKMSNGVGVGTSFATFKRRVRGERCYKVRRQAVCAVTRGDVTMAFVEKRRRVYSVSLSSATTSPEAPQQR